MFEAKTFAVTPANARRLMEFHRLKGTAVTDEVRELAATDVVAARLADEGIQVDSRQETALQRILDWDGRGMLFSDKSEQGQEIGMLVCRLRNPCKILVLANTNQYAPWVEHFQRQYPNRKLCIFGNPRHKGGAKLPADVPFQDRPDTTADIIITNYMSVVWHDLLDSWVPDQVLVEEFSTAGAGIASYKNKEILVALFRELPAPLFLQNVSGYRHNGALLHTESRKRNQNVLWDIEELLEWGVWASTGFPGTALMRKTPTITTAMHSWGYGSIDAWRALPLLGVSAELVSMDNGPVTDHVDNSVTKHSKRNKQSGYSRVAQREQEMLAEQGTEATALVRAALGGDRAAKTLLEGLRTMQWANAKSASIRNIIDEVGLFPLRSLIIADNLNLRRALMLNLNFTGYDRSSYCETLPISGVERGLIKTRFTADGGVTQKPVSALIVTLQDLDDGALLHTADNIVFAEWPLDRAIYDVVKEDYAIPNACRFIQTTLAGTIEEEIRKQITNP